MVQFKIQPKGFLNSKQAAKFLGYKNQFSLYHTKNQKWFKKRVQMIKLGGNIFYNLKNLKDLKK